MMNSSRICPAVGSQYKDSAVGLVFMETAAGLAMETSRVKSVVRNQAEAKLNQLEYNMESAVMTSALMSSQSAVGYQQMKRGERDEATSCWRISRWIRVDDVIGNVIIFSRWFERVVARISRTAFFLALKIQQEDFALITSRKNQSQDTSWKHMFNTSWTTRRKQQQHPVESLLESAVAIYPVASYSGSSRELQCFCYPFDMEIQTQEKKNSSAKYPVDKETAVARSVVTKNKQQLSEQLLNNLLNNIQPLQAINDQDGKNQWLRFSVQIASIQG
ncbi:hypothetical protein F511_19231 [Dorcoceras hygrometricum]|uniref:Uncharacterized protein n=1 Tax=Dorcoceras hygrometricum TaxID=472368 RepID=A0A2Z7BQ95_9LAMI|nr:hypothetical protein F511_19231 [Dorcoceras hygrometricum]